MVSRKLIFAELKSYAESYTHSYLGTLKSRVQLCYDLRFDLLI
jgi:hypothetical protein